MIRKAEKKDASRLAEILVFAKRTAYRPIFNNDIVSFNEINVLDTALDYRDNSESLCGVYVYDDGIVKGMMSIKTAVDGDTTRWELKELYVDPFFQKNGIGRELITFFISLAKSQGAESAILWVLEKNTTAIRFYEGFGFKFEGTRVKEPGTPEFQKRYIKMF